MIYYVQMKILIGTPIHQVKDYAMERWLENVSKLEYPADFLMVDNSPGLSYMEKVKSYCAKYGIKNYQLEHLELNKKIIPDKRIEMAQEKIRQEVLTREYDAWFSWECDQLIPLSTLGDMVKIMDSGDFTMVNCNSWARIAPDETNTDLGCALIKRKGLENNSFVQYDEPWFKLRVVNNGGSLIDVYGVINPIYHLDG